MENKQDTTRDAIRKYFTSDIFKAINEIDGELMRTLLKELEGTPVWFAILKYSQERISILQNSLLTIDPIKNATEIARYQGVVTGLLDLQDVVLTLKYESEKSADPKNKEEVNKNELGGAYGKY